MHGYKGAIIHSTLKREGWSLVVGRYNPSFEDLHQLSSPKFSLLCNLLVKITSSLIASSLHGGQYFYFYHIPQQVQSPVWSISAYSRRTSIKRTSTRIASSWVHAVGEVVKYLAKVLQSGRRGDPYDRIVSLSGMDEPGTTHASDWVPILVSALRLGPYTRVCDVLWRGIESNGPATTREETIERWKRDDLGPWRVDGGISQNCANHPKDI
jgi:hypothetical protein